MTQRLAARVVRRPSLPLTETDERELSLLRGSSAHRDALSRLSGEDVGSEQLSESAILHATLLAGLAAVRELAQEEGYAALAAEQADETRQRREEARRRPPSWVDEA